MQAMFDVVVLETPERAARGADLAGADATGERAKSSRQRG